MKHRRHLVVLVTSLILMAPATPSASAFPEPDTTDEYGHADCGPLIDADFEGNWNPTLKTTVFDAISEWETIKGSSTKLVDIQAAPDAGWADSVVDIEFYDIYPYNGASGCPYDYSGVILLDDFYADGYDLGALGDVARHEMGHIFGLTHTGDDDSFGSVGEVASMATCRSTQGDTSRVLGQDDSGALAHKETGIAKPPITANLGFEDNSSTPPLWWGKTGGTWSLGTDDPYKGSRYLIWRPSDEDHYVYQTMNFAESDDATIDAVLHGLKTIEYSTGSVTARVYRRVVEYGTSPSCSYPTDMDQNVRLSVTSYSYVSGSEGSLTPTSSWQSLNGPDVTVDLGTDEHAWDVQIRVFSTMQYLGQYATVGLDQVNIRHTG